MSISNGFILYQLGKRSRKDRSQMRTHRPMIERMEERIALASDFAMLSATTHDSRSVEISYRIDGDGGLPMNVAIYRSADASFDPTDVQVATTTVVDPTGISTGTHSLTVAVSGGLTIDPTHPFVLAVADPSNTVAETDESNDVALFRKFIIGGLSHGTDAAPAWEPVMASSLQAGGYDRVVPFFWVSESLLPVPGQAVAAGQRMAAQIIAAAHTLPSGAIIDLHLLGHSRGSVVISEALQTIEALAASGTDPQLQGILAGWTRMTYLDPHPAHNVHTTTTSSARFFSASPGPFGRLGTQILLRFQDAMNDPEPRVPGSADEAEVFFQHAPYYAASDPVDRILNIWGETPVQGATRYIDLTGIANGHYVIPYWYQANVVPTLRTGAVFTPPSPTALPSAPTRNPIAFERSVLFPALVTRPGVASGLLARASSTASALERGNTRQGIRRYLDLVRFAQQRRNRIDPAMLNLLGAIRPVIVRPR